MATVARVEKHAHTYIHTHSGALDVHKNCTTQHYLKASYPQKAREFPGNGQGVAWEKPRYQELSSCYVGDDYKKAYLR